MPIQCRLLVRRAHPLATRSLTGAVRRLAWLDDRGTGGDLGDLVAATLRTELRYCALETQAMIEIWRILAGSVGPER